MNKKSHEVDIDIGEFIETLKHYRNTIFFVFLSVFIVGMVVIYFSPSVYSSNSTLLTASEQSSQDIMMQQLMEGAVGASESSPDTSSEIAILKSKRLIYPVLKKLGYETRFFAKKHFKKVEFYGNSAPFVLKDLNITNPKILGNKIQITPLNKGLYRLKIEQSFLKRLTSSESDSIEHDKIYRFGERIETPFLTWKLEMRKGFDYGDYSDYVISLNSVQGIYKGVQNKFSASKGEGSILVLKFEDNVPLRTQGFLNTLLDDYLRYHLDIKTQDTSQVLAFIDKRLKEIGKKLQVSQGNLQRFKSAESMIDVPSQVKELITKISKLNAELSNLQLKKREVDMLVNRFSGNSAFRLDFAAPTEDPALTNMLNSLKTKQLELQDLQQRYSSIHPSVKSARMQIKVAKGQVVNYISSLQKQLASKISSVKNTLAKYDKKLRSYPGTQEKFVNLNRDYGVNEKLYSFLLAKQAELSINRASTMLDTKIIDRAEYPDKIKPKIPLMFAATIILGLILGIIVAIFRAFLDKKIHTVKQVEALSNTPVYGVIPKLLPNKTAGLEVLSDPKGVYAEAMRTVRTNISFATAARSSSIILVTSSIPGEGKTTIASNLAAISAYAQHKTIIVNTDMRKARLYQVLGVSRRRGMSTLLSGRHSLEEVIQKTEHENLDVICAGPVPPNPSELIASNRMNETLNELSEIYEYIIIDSAPLGLVTDAKLLIPLSTVTLMTCRADYADKELIKEFDKMIEQLDLKDTSVGIILNGVETARLSYGYYGDYGKYGE